MRWAGLVVTGLLAGCTVVVPSITTHTVVNPAVPTASAPASEEPWPARGPLVTPGAGTRLDERFSGEGKRERIGPVALKNRSFTVTVRFETLVVDGGSLRLELLDREGLFVQSLLSERGSFERTITRDVEIRDDYYLSLPQADGRWELRVEVE